jgi:histidinol dehydrogenase
VTSILERVRAHGDSALVELARQFDGATMSAIEVPTRLWESAVDSLDPAVRRALERSAANIAAVHEAFAPVSTQMRTVDGVLVGRRADAFARVGVYAPGGRAAYPSSLLMGVVPARVAGVREVVVCSPPTRSGVPGDIILAAAAIGGAHRVFAAGGAGAIAALAFGTETIPRVDRIVGPGNAFVAEAKLQVASVVGIDSPAGPSELLVLADGSASVTSVAREVLAQAEHDPDASVVLVATDARWLDALSREIGARLPHEPRTAIIAEAFRARGAMLTARDDDEALAFASEFAAEHVLLAVNDPAAWLPRVRNTGTVFLGITSSVAFGDYLTGANHVLPTAGLARAYSGLSTSDFVRWTTYQHVDRSAAARLASDTAILATAEGLPAHAEAARQWRVQ